MYKNLTKKQIYNKLTKDKILMPHNFDAYIEVVKEFEEEDNVCTIRACGTGKSYINLQLAYDNLDKKFIILVPRRDIKMQYEKHIESLKEKDPTKDFSNVTVVTYSSLLTKSDEDLKNLKVDYLVCDEFQHLGAPKWSAKVKLIKELHNGIKTFGTTALAQTLETYLKGVDLIKEWFDNNLVAELPAHEAIARGILPTPKVYVLLKTENYIKELEDYLKNGRFSGVIERRITKEINEIRKKSSEEESLKQIFKQLIKPGEKWIFFVPRGTMPEMIEKSKQWLSEIEAEENIKRYFVHSNFPKQSEINSIDFYNDTDNTKLRIMFAIDKYNEGVHPPDIDGVVLLRPTLSEGLFEQQFNRAMASGDLSKTPKIIDVENNLYNIYKFKAKIEKKRAMLEKENPTLYKSKDKKLNFEIELRNINAIRALASLKGRVKLSLTKKIEEYIEGLGTKYIPCNDDTVSTFSNGEIVGTFFNDNYDILKQYLFLNSKYKSLKYQKARICFYKYSKEKPKINKISEFIEFMNIGFRPDSKDNPMFSDGSSADNFWEDNNHIIIEELFFNKIYKEGYDVAKLSCKNSYLGKAVELIIMMRDGYVPSEYDGENNFIDGDPIGNFYIQNFSMIFKEVYKNKYNKKYWKARDNMISYLEKNPEMLRCVYWPGIDITKYYESENDIIYDFYLRHHSSVFKAVMLDIDRKMYRDFNNDKEKVDSAFNNG